MQTNTLYNRLVAAFIFITFILSGLYGVLVYHAMKYTEDDILMRRVEMEIEHFMAEYATDRQSATLPENHELQGYLSTSPDIPDWLLQEPTGIRELHDREVHVGITPLPDDDGFLYIVLSELDSSSLESQTPDLIMILASVGAIITLIGLGLGVLLGRQITRPLHRLTHEIEVCDLQAVETRKSGFYGADRNDEVGVLSRSFAQLVERMSNFLERERNFTRHASHELRTPITVINNALAVISLPESAPATKQKNLGRIKDAAQEMADLVESFLYLGREKGNLDRESINLTELVENSLEKHAYINEDQHLTVMTKLAADVTVYNDKKLIKILVDNILRNMLLHGHTTAMITLRKDHLVVENDAMSPEDEQAGGRSTFGLSIIERITQHCQLSSKINLGSGRYSIEIEFAGQTS